MTEPTTPPGTVAVVLAAGAATRFGPSPGAAPGGLGAKLLVPLDGRALVTHAVGAALRAGAARVRLVVPQPDDALRLLVAVATEGDPRVELVASPERDAGLARSLAAGIDGLADAPDVRVVVVLLGDAPRVTASAVAAVASAVGEGAPAARARYDDGPGHPVAFAPEVLPRVAALAGDVGARDLLTEVGVRDVAVAGAAPHDVDTPDDLGRVTSPTNGPERPA